MESNTLEIFNNKPIILGISGGVAIYKSCQIASRLTQVGAKVRVIMTRAASRLIRPLLFESITSIPVVYDLFGRRNLQAMEHIWAAGDAQGAIIAPATANILAKCALGIADDALSTTMLCSLCPTVFAPAMNSNMWRHHATQEHVISLRQRGWLQVGPEVGHLACGWEDIGRMADPEQIVLSLANLLSKAQSLSGKRILVSAGPTYEHIDDFRILTNPSTGKMGYAIAEAATNRGAEVTLVSGPSQLSPPPVQEFLTVRSAAEMKEVSDRLFAAMDIVIFAAAVADFTPETSYKGKIVKSEVNRVLNLKPTDDILAGLGQRKQKQFLVGFAAESADSDLLEKGRAKLEGKNLDLILVNPIGEENAGFGNESNRGWLIWRCGTQEIPTISKTELAGVILDKVTELCNG